ncbi:hypothetical protein [Pseudomonas japonica]|uniref:Tyrosine specific protein phosphatases domain-containing protein n=1 Tax=Pseudomonas japonica TaxID=256466 RepID=A0A239DRK8_9PSED|nr:hypothetical protein [Pseudomonas japonica]SNS34839.1 hypothetical protein SAMN05444352_106219 [Pseudomonas japonica]
MTTTDKKIHGHGNFIPGSVRVVDYNSYFNNILVRGSSAFGAKTEAGDPFVIADLIAAIKSDENFASTGITLSANPMVIDFCLIGFGSEKDQKIVESEIAWFAEGSPTPNGNSGPYPVYFSATNSGVAAGTTMMYWPIQALGSSLLQSVGATWNPSPANSIGPGTSNEGFNYSALVPAIWNALQNQTPNLPGVPATLQAITNAIIYVHCDSGVNRTGAAVAGYLMTFGSNLAALDLPASNGVPCTLAKAQAAAGRAAPSNDSPPGGVDIPVTQAYCNYIYTKNIDGELIAACLPASS